MVFLPPPATRVPSSFLSSWHGALDVFVTLDSSHGTTPGSAAAAAPRPTSGASPAAHHGVMLCAPPLRRHDCRCLSPVLCHAAAAPGRWLLTGHASCARARVSQLCPDAVPAILHTQLYVVPVRNGAVAPLARRPAKLLLFVLPCACMCACACTGGSSVCLAFPCVSPSFHPSFASIPATAAAVSPHGGRRGAPDTGCLLAVCAPALTGDRRR